MRQRCKKGPTRTSDELEKFLDKIIESVNFVRLKANQRGGGMMVPQIFFALFVTKNLKSF